MYKTLRDMLISWPSVCFGSSRACPFFSFNAMVAVIAVRLDPRHTNEPQDSDDIGRHVTGNGQTIHMVPSL